jgi:hypothetical protein
MKTSQIVFPLTLEQSQMLHAAWDIPFKPDFLPLELHLSLEYEEGDGSLDRATMVLMGINRIVVTDGSIQARAS